MAYVAPVHNPTSIRHALRCRFLSPEHDDLVIAKANRLEIWRVTEDGIACLQTKLIYGTVAMLQSLRPKDSDLDMLFVATDRLQYFNVTWNSETKQMEVVQETIDDHATHLLRQSQSQNKCLVDPTGKFMAMHLFEGILNVFRLPVRKGSTTKLDLLEQVRLTELWMKASTFIHSRTGHPQIAFLYKAQLDREEARLAIYRLTSDDKGTEVSRFDPHKNRELDEIIRDPFASMLIPVPVPEEKRYHHRNNEGAKAHLGGLIVVGETLLTYYDSLNHSSVATPLDEPKIYVAWADYDGTRFFLADDYGRLDVLTMETQNESSNNATGVVVTGMNTRSLKFPNSATLTSRASTLVYMGNDMLFLASHHGDSQLLRIDIDAGLMQLVTSVSNNGPVLDFAIMDMGNREGDHQFGNTFSSGQTRLVAGCGAFRDGSLRSIRSGVGLEDRGILDDLAGAKGLYTLRSYGASHANTVVASFIGETRVLRFDSDGDIEEVYEFSGMAFDTETLLAANLPSGELLQITPKSVTTFDSESGIATSTWSAPEGKSITAASANRKWALIAVDGVTLVALNLKDNLSTVIQSADTEQADQISCLHAAHDLEEFGVVGWWSKGTISILRLATLEAIHGESFRQTDDSATVPRDIALVQLHPPAVSGPTLLIAMEDGNVVTFNVSADGSSLSGRKSVTLGSSPARLHILPEENGVCNVFATTEHSSLIYSSEGRIIYSATTADDATYVAPFDSEAFPNSIILSTDKHVAISHVDKERLTHVKTLPVFETVRRVAYSPALKLFGIGCIKKELRHNEEIITSSFRLVDEIVFQELGKPFLLGASTSLEMVECVIRAELPDSTGSKAERFIVGTSFIPDETIEESDSTRGRILVLGVDQNRQIYQIVSHNLKGSCRCLSTIGDYIVAGLSKTVVVYNYVEETTTHGSLQKLVAHRPSSFPVDLDVSGNMIGVVDLMQSLSLIQFSPPLDGSNAKLEELARHHEPAWATAVCHLDGERWLEVDAQGNIIVLRRNPDAPLASDRAKLEITSEINIGEQINKIRKLNVVSSETAVVSPRAFLGSIEGTFYMYGDISPNYQDLLMKFQSNLQDYVQALGGMEFNHWRAFRNSVRDGDGPYRFIDGEMVERFLDLDERKQEMVCEGLGPSVEDMRNLVEELRRLH